MRTGTEKLWALAIDGQRTNIATAMRHVADGHGDPCDCPADAQRRWRGRRRLREMRQLWTRFVGWLEWQVGR